MAGEKKWWIRAHQAQCREVKAAITAPPEQVPVAELLTEVEIVKLAPEAKHLTHTINYSKMVAYRAATALVRCLAPSEVDG